MDSGDEDAGMRMSSAYQVGNRTKRILKIKITEEQ